MVPTPVATLAEAPILGAQVAQTTVPSASSTVPVPVEATPRAAAAATAGRPSTARRPLQAFLATLRRRSSAAVGAPTVAALNGRGRKATGRGPAAARAADAPTPATSVPSASGPHGGPTSRVPSHGVGAPTGPAPAPLPCKVAARLVSASPVRPLPIGLLAAPSGPAEDVPTARAASRLATPIVLLAPVRAAPPTVVGVAEAGDAPTGLHCREK